MLGFQDLGEARRQGQQGLAGAGLAQEGDEINFRVHEWYIHKG